MDIMNSTLPCASPGCGDAPSVDELLQGIELLLKSANHASFRPETADSLTPENPSRDLSSAAQAGA